MDTKIDDLVIIKEDIALLYWKLGRVIEVHPDAGRKMHCLKLKTVNDELKWALTKFSM